MKKFTIKNGDDELELEIKKMVPIIVHAKKYNNRKDLETEIKKVFGTDILKNNSLPHKIVGTKEELKNLYLSDKSTIFGIKCEYE
jgi:hypothetical protein